MDKSRTETTTETSRGESRMRGFFERAADRVRNAVRNARGTVGHRRMREMREDVRGYDTRRYGRWEEPREEPRGRPYGRGRFTSSFGGGYDESDRWDEGTVHEPMLDWRETASREYGATGPRGERRPYREDRDEEWGRSGGRGRGW